MGIALEKKQLNCGIHIFETYILDKSYVSFDSISYFLFDFTQRKIVIQFFFIFGQYYFTCEDSMGKLS